MNPVFLRALQMILDENRAYCVPMLKDGEYDLYAILVKAIERGDLQIRKEILEDAIQWEEERLKRVDERFYENHENKGILARMKKYLGWRR